MAEQDKPKLTVLTATISRNAGGLFESVRHLHQSLSKNYSTDVITSEDQFSDEDSHVWSPLNLHIVKPIPPKSIGFSPVLLRLLKDKHPDLIHVHGLWQGPSIASVCHQRVKDVKSVVSPRGMLDPWAVRRSKWKKRLATFFFEKKHLSSASCLHALCREEADAIRNFGLKGPICIVPNGVSIPPEPKKTSQQCSHRILLFLGRIHPKKGLVRAIQAWAEVESRSDWTFVIAGWDQAGHLADLKELCQHVGLPHVSIDLEKHQEIPEKYLDQYSVIFTGPAFGELKSSLLRAASAFILASHSEGLPMSVLEAWAYRLPVLMTDHCNLPDGFAENAAIKISLTDDKSPFQSGISGPLRDVIKMPEQSLKEIGCRGRRLVERKYTWDIVSDEMASVYRWILDKGSRPDRVEV